jgi:TRAP-type C4-dicarboxylate transport system permease small subunit
MQLPMIIPYLSVPVSFFFISIHTLDLILKNFQGKKEAL